MPNQINALRLEIGQWIKFSTKKDLESLTKLQQKLYKEQPIFLVVACEDKFKIFSPWRCLLLDESGKLHGFKPGYRKLGYTDLEDDNVITSFSDAEVQAKYGKDKMSFMHQAAKDCLPEIRAYMNEAPVKKLEEMLEPDTFSLPCP